MKKVAIIQARMGSTRLPGKVLKQVLDKPLLQYQLERVKRSNYLDQIVVATTDQKNDDIIEYFCLQHALSVYRGSEHDVLQRYMEAAQRYEADVIVRLTADCPVISPEIIDQVIQTYLQVDERHLYVSNTMKRTFPRGMDVEVFSYDVLQQVEKNAALLSDREHVTKYIQKHPHLFSLVDVLHEQDLSHHRWTVDTQEDFLLVKKMLETIYPRNRHFTMDDLLKIIELNPSWYHINAHVEQRETS